MWTADCRAGAAIGRETTIRRVVDQHLCVIGLHGENLDVRVPATVLPDHRDRVNARFDDVEHKDRIGRPPTALKLTQVEARSRPGPASTRKPSSLFTPMVTNPGRELDERQDFGVGAGERTGDPGDTRHLLVRREIAGGATRDRIEVDDRRDFELDERANHGAGPIAGPDSCGSAKLSVMGVPAKSTSCPASASSVSLRVVWAVTFHSERCSRRNPGLVVSTPVAFIAGVSMPKVGAVNVLLSVTTFPLDRAGRSRKCARIHSRTGPRACG